MKRLMNWFRVGIGLWTGAISNERVEALFPIVSRGVPKTYQHVSTEFLYVDSIDLGPQNNMDLVGFFTSKRGLHSFEGFVNSVLRYINGSSFRSDRIVVDYFDLRENLWDREIRAKFPHGYALGLVDGLACIAWLIYKQWQGEESGALRVNTDAFNVFYLDVFGTIRVIGVHRLGGYDGWGIDSWEPDAKVPEFSGFRVFICGAKQCQEP
ncbi:MAG: hypothetical protein PHT88_01370 [Candidatus Moranbacteria bacterium]|nr:hypothetical protein [Candidatus Moranbacteria bacterium]